jgi:hypothetical protein
MPKKKTAPKKAKAGGFRFGSTKKAAKPRKPSGIRYDKHGNAYGS